VFGAGPATGPLAFGLCLTRLRALLQLHSSGMAPPLSALPPPEKPKSPAARVPVLARQMALALELPFVFVATIVIGGGIGYWLDQRFHTSPLFLLLLGGLGFAAGLREVIRRISHSGSDRGS